MTVEVLFKLRQVLSDAVLGSSLAGDGLLVRLRSTSIALLGMVAVVGLGLVAFISQLGWPSVFSGPLPQGPTPSVIRNDPISLVRVSPRRDAPVPPARPDSTAATDRLPPPAPAPATQAAPPPSGGTAPGVVVSPAGSPPAHATPPRPGKAPEPAPPPAPAPVEVAPPDAEVSAVPPATETEDDSPGKSGEAHGHAPGGGPPPWAGNGGGQVSGHEGPGKPGRGEG